MQGARVRYDRSHARLSVAARARRAPPRSRYRRPAAQPDNPQEEYVSVPRIFNVLLQLDTATLDIALHTLLSKILPEIFLREAQGKSPLGPVPPGFSENLIWPYDPDL